MKLEISLLGKYVGKQYLDNTGNEFLTIAAYQVVDVRATATFYPRKSLEIGLSMWMNNVLNAMYSSNGYTFSYLYETRVSERFYYPQAGRNILFGLQVRY